MTHTGVRGENASEPTAIIKRHLTAIHLPVRQFTMEGSNKTAKHLAVSSKNSNFAPDLTRKGMVP